MFEIENPKDFSEKYAKLYIKRNYKKFSPEQQEEIQELYRNEPPPVPVATSRPIRFKAQKEYSMKLPRQKYFSLDSPDDESDLAKAAVLALVTKEATEAIKHPYKDWDKGIDLEKAKENFLKKTGFGKSKIAEPGEIQQTEFKPDIKEFEAKLEEKKGLIRSILGTLKGSLW